MLEGILKRLYNVKEAAKYLGLSVWGVRRLIWDGHLVAVRQGRRVLVDVNDMNEFIERNKTGGSHGDDLP